MKLFLVLLLVTNLLSCTVGDDTPPGDIEDLTFDPVNRNLLWTAPGDNGDQGQATIYFIRYFTAQQVAELLDAPSLDGIPFDVIQTTVQDNFSEATQIPDFQQPDPAGSPQNFVVPRLDITGETTYFYGIFTNDEVGNSSDPSNIVELDTPLGSVRYVSGEEGGCIGDAVTAANFSLNENEDESDDDADLNDIAIGDPCVGKVYIFFGREDLTDDGSTIVDVSTADVTVIGDPLDAFGAVVQGIPDFGGDIVTDELLISAPDFDGGRGKVYLLFGSRNLEGDIDLINGDIEHIEIVGENPGDNFGFSLSEGQGVFRGTGVFIVGTPFFGSDRGKAYLFEGGDLSTDNVNPSSEAKATVTGPSPGALFAFDLAFLGQIEGNSNNEFGGGAPGVGRAYIIFGDRNPETIDLSFASDRVLVLEGSAEEEFGFSISGDGDIDEDGEETPDVIVGAPGRVMNMGSVFLYSGTDIETAFNDGTAIFFETEFTGINPGDRFGESISVMPNLTPLVEVEEETTANVLDLQISNADFGVSAPGTAEGTVYLFFGRDDFPAAVSASQADITINGGPEDIDFSIVVQGLGDVNGDLIDDFAVGGLGFIQVYF